LRDAEAHVWGSTTQPSAISIRLDKQPTRPTPLEVFTKRGARWVVKKEHDPVAYALFPLKPPDKSTEDPGVLWQFSSDPITLVLRFPERACGGLIEALQAWSLFGGLGARTRRGFGAIESATPDAMSAEEFLATLSERRRIPHVPSLCGARLDLGGEGRSSMDALGIAISSLQRFRQGPGLGRRHGKQPKRPGRSYWPEPDQLREHSGSRAPKHAPISNIAKFPRAAFGLPIIFHFSTSGDPEDATLTPAGGLHRFASPLLLRPARSPTGKYRAMAVVLANTSPTDPLTLTGRDSRRTSYSKAVTWQLTQDEANGLRPLDKCTDPLEAFLRHFSGTPKVNT